MSSRIFLFNGFDHYFGRPWAVPDMMKSEHSGAFYWHLIRSPSNFDILSCYNHRVIPFFRPCRYHHPSPYRGIYDSKDNSCHFDHSHVSHYYCHLVINVTAVAAMCVVNKIVVAVEFSSDIRLTVLGFR